MKRIVSAASAALAILTASSAAFAVTYLVPRDSELIERAQAIVVAHAATSHCELAPSGNAVTIADLTVDEVLKGTIETGSTIHVVELGGIVGRVGTSVPGAPRYQNGQKYLVMLGRNQYGDWGTYAMGLGQFRFVQDITGREFVVRGDEAEISGYSAIDWTPHVEQVREANGFATYIRSVVDGGLAAARTDYLVNRADVVLTSFRQRKLPNSFRIVSNATRMDYLSDVPLRWKIPTATVYYCCASKSYQGAGSTLDAVTAFGTALGRWDGAGAGVNYISGGNNESATGGLTGYGRSHHDGINAVLFGDPYGDLPNPGGGSFLLGIGGGNGCSYTGPDSLTYFGPDVPGCGVTTEIDVIINDSIDPVGQVRFNAAVTHELGHTLGFRHSDKDRSDSGACSAPLPCEFSSAIMRSFIDQDYFALQQWDRDAITTVYGSGCSAPAISSQPQASPTSVTSGNSSQLSVGATGTATLSYQWYIGNPPSTASPTGTNSATINVTPASTTNYWVHVTNGCGSADSNAVTVTVTGACTPPGISVQPQATPSTINAGNQSQLSVTATGSALAYQWYAGNPTDTSSPVPAGTSATINVSPANTTTYWVRVTNGCGTANSTAVTVTVSAGCVPPSFNQQPVASPQTISTGGSSQLSVVMGGTGPFTYQWYVGSPGNTSQTVPAGTSSVISVSPTVTTTYWVRVNNACGQADSNAVTVTFSNGCAPPNVLSQPQDQTVTPGNVTLFVGYTGTSGNVNWYQGAAPDTSHLVGSGQSLQLNVTSTTQYWAQIVNNCGSANSRTTTITVTQSCTAPGVTSIAANPTTVAANAQSVLAVVATGTSLQYQWYRGNSGDTSNPIAGATATTVNVNPAATTSYWVRVSNTCGTVDSVKVTVTVSASCTPPTISTQPLSTKILSGQTITLSVIASGTPLTYQWYQGPVDNTSTPIGTNSSNVDVRPLLTTSYWVKVTNTCGDAKSNAAVITVTPAKHRAVSH